MCMVDTGDGMVEILRTEDRKARKIHKCHECGRQIQPGETYLYEAFVFDGFGTHKTCAHCQIPRKFILDHCHGFLYGQIREDLWDHVLGGEYGGKLARLFVGMKRQWKAFRSESLMPVPKEEARTQS